MNYFFFFFFSSRRRHTRFDCDWSSDVCSSDLGGRAVGCIDQQDRLTLVRDEPYAVFHRDSERSSSGTELTQLRLATLYTSAEAESSRAGDSTALSRTAVSGRSRASATSR